MRRATTRARSWSLVVTIAWIGCVGSAVDEEGAAAPVHGQRRGAPPAPEILNLRLAEMAWYSEPLEPAGRYSTVGFGACEAVLVPGEGAPGVLGRYRALGYRYAGVYLGTLEFEPDEREQDRRPRLWVFWFDSSAITLQELDAGAPFGARTTLARPGNPTQVVGERDLAPCRGWLDAGIARRPDGRSSIAPRGRWMNDSLTGVYAAADPSPTYFRELRIGRCHLSADFAAGGWEKGNFLALGDGRSGVIDLDVGELGVPASEPPVALGGGRVFDPELAEVWSFLLVGEDLIVQTPARPAPILLRRRGPYQGPDDRWCLP